MPLSQLLSGSSGVEVLPSRSTSFCPRSWQSSYSFLCRSSPSGGRRPICVRSRSAPAESTRPLASWQAPFPGLRSTRSGMRGSTSLSFERISTGLRYQPAHSQTQASEHSSSRRVSSSWRPAAVLVGGALPNMRLKLPGARLGAIAFSRLRALPAAQLPCARQHFARSLSAIR